MAVSLTSTCDSKDFLLKIDMDGVLAVENNSVYLLFMLAKHSIVYEVKQANRNGILFCANLEAHFLIRITQPQWILSNEYEIA